MKMKRIVILSLVMLFTLAQPVNVWAVAYGDVRNAPRGVWAVLDPYNEALNANDSAGIVTHGKRLIDFWLNGQTREARARQWGADPLAFGFNLSNVFWASYNMGNHALLLGDRQNALWAFETAYLFLDPWKVVSPTAGGNPDDLEFTRTRLRTLIATLDVSASLYAELRDGTGRTAAYETLHAPRTGIMFGEPYGPSAVKDGPKPPSAMMIYAEFEQKNLPERVAHDLAANEALGFAREDYSIIQIAWNFLHEGSTPPQVLREEAIIREAARFLAETELPILLRVGGEMDIWGNQAKPEEFKAAFRFIANIMRQEAPNVALVYSVNVNSAAGVDWMTFYPGDAYVDWVGISLYTSRYFRADPNTSDADAAIWRTGPYANPVAVMRELVDMFGSRKPILISEGSVSLRNIPNNEDLTEWALPRIRKTYEYIPMLFPEVKAIFWFNVRIAGDPGGVRHDFTVSPRARQLYTQLTNNDYFLGFGQTASPVTFAEVSRPGGVTLPAKAVTLLTYAPFFTLDGVGVQYFLDERRIGQSDVIPYRLTVDLSDRADGEYPLLVRVVHNDRELQDVHYKLVKQGDRVTITRR
jgi:hypothetical protein